MHNYDKIAVKPLNDEALSASVPATSDLVGAYANGSQHRANRYTNFDNQDKAQVMIANTPSPPSPDQLTVATNAIGTSRL